MSTYADLEIALRRRDADKYAAEFRFNAPGAEADIRVGGGDHVTSFDVARLRSLELDSAAYGSILTEALFGNVALASALAQARAATQAANAALRIRLFIEPNAGELHSLRWETLRDPVR